MARDPVTAGILGLLEASEALKERIFRKPLTIVSAPEFVVPAMLHGASIAALRQQGKYPSLRLLRVEVLRPNRDVSNIAPTDMHAVALNMYIEDFEGDWTPGRVFSSIGRDPEDRGAEPQVIVQKLWKPSSQAVGPGKMRGGVGDVRMHSLLRSAQLAPGDAIQVLTAWLYG